MRGLDREGGEKGWLTVVISTYTPIGGNKVREGGSGDKEREQGRGGQVRRGPYTKRKKKDRGDGGKCW